MIVPIEVPMCPRKAGVELQRGTPCNCTHMGAVTKSTSCQDTPIGHLLWIMMFQGPRERAKSQASSESNRNRNWLECRSSICKLGAKDQAQKITSYTAWGLIFFPKSPVPPGPFLALHLLEESLPSTRCVLFSL